MDRKFGYYIVLGLVIGAVFGVALGSAIGNTALGVMLGAIGGVFLGWFVAAAVLENQKTKKEGDLMKPLRWAFAQKHPVLTFLLIAFAWSWFFWFAAILFRGQTQLVSAIANIGGYGPAVGGILTLGLKSGLKPDLSPKKMVTMIVASMIIFAVIFLRFLARSIPNLATLAQDPALLCSMLVQVAASLLGGWVISSAVASNTDIRARMGSILPRRLPPGWTVLAILVYPLLLLFALGLSSLQGAEAKTLHSLLSWDALPVWALGFGTTFLVTGGPEEIGWRGLMQPELQRRFSPLGAALLVTLFWVLWHLPLYLNGTYPGDWVSGMINQSILGVPFAVFLAWFYNRSGGNLFLMMFLHAGYNNTAGAVAADSPLSLLVFWFVVMVAVVVKDKMWRKLETWEISEISEV